MPHLMAPEVKPDDADIGPVMSAVEQDERLGRLVVERNAEIVRVIAQLGGNPHTSAREGPLDQEARGGVLQRASRHKP